MELNEKQNIINKEKFPKKKISPFLQKLYNILEVRNKNNNFIYNKIYRMKIIKTLFVGIKKEMAL